MFIPMPRSKAALAVILALASLAAAPLTASAKTLVYCSEGSPENFTPAINTTGTSFDAARPMFDQLVIFERGSTKVIPGLAESWESSADGLTITFKLRKGVKFHSGVNGFKPTRDFNADDVLFSIERQWKADHPYAKVSGGKYDYFAWKPQFAGQDAIRSTQTTDRNPCRQARQISPFWPLEMSTWRQHFRD